MLVAAYLNSHFQTGLKNVLDRAILDHRGGAATWSPSSVYRKMDEIPFDFSRRMMSVVVETPEGHAPADLTKGARRRSSAAAPASSSTATCFAMEQILIEDLKEEYENLSADGFRVLAVAYKDVRAAGGLLQGRRVGPDPERLRGLPRPAQGDRRRRPSRPCKQHGVTVKVLTGDNELVSRKICHEVGLPTEHMVLGTQVETMTDAELADGGRRRRRSSPGSRPPTSSGSSRRCRGKGHVVGFLGDGINDAPACARPTWASRSIRPSTSPRNRPT